MGPPAPFRRSPQGGAVPPATQRRGAGARGSGGGGLRPGQSLPLRPRKGGRGREVIIIDSEDSEGGSEYGGCSDEPIRPSSRGLVSKPIGRIPALSLPTPPTKKPGIHAIAKDSDTVRYRTLDTPSSLVPRRSGSIVINENGRYHRLLATPSTLAPSSSLDDSRPFSPRRTDKTGEVVRQKAHSNMGTSREGLASTATANSASTTRFNGMLPSDPTPEFPLAVKSRIYSSPRHGSQRNMSSGSQRLEAFGFMPATKPAARTANAMKRDAAAIGTTAPTPIYKAKPKFITINEMGIKQLKQEAEEPVQTQTIYSPTVPQTPRQPITTRRASNWSSPSIGTPGDPYTLSSDNDSDSDVDDNVKTTRQSHKLRSLKSFADITDIHETASDVEAALDQFPAWLTTPSPPEPRSAYRSVPTSSQPSTASCISARPRDGYREKHHVRFGGGDGFSPSPVPPKRAAAAAAPLEQTSPHIRVLSMSSPTRLALIASSGRVVKSDFTLDEHTNGVSNHRNKDEKSSQHGKEMLPNKRKGAVSREEKRLSRYRNVDRETWRRKKKALKKALKIKHKL